MIDNIMAASANMAVSGPDTLGTVPAGALGSDIERFRVAMSAPAEGTAPVVDIAANAASEPVVRAATTPAGRITVGDAILDSFRSAAQNASSEWSAAMQAVMSRDMTAAQMLQTQMKLISVSFQIELIGKGVSKATTNLEQTLKTQ